MYRALAFLILFTGSMGQITLNGTCNFTNIMSEINLNLTRLSGDWYQIKRINNLQENGTCSTMSINTTLTNYTSPKITISSKEVANKKMNYRSGNITASHGFGRFSVKLPDITYDSMVLATNYTDYAVLYSCNNINNSTKNVWAWVVSRNSTLNKNQKDFIDTIINGYEELKGANWIISEHTKKACDPNSSVSFKVSPILILVTVFIVCKDLFTNKVMQ